MLEQDKESFVSPDSKKDCLVVGMFSKDEMPYASHYVDVLESKGASYDIVYFNRYKQECEIDENEIVFQKYCPTGGSKVAKLGTMLEYARFIRKILNQGSYKFVIVLTTVPAVFLLDILIRKYKNNYILDIRDYTYEDNFCYRLFVSRLISKSFVTTLSSRGFLSFLPESEKYRFTHNVPKKLEIKKCALSKLNDSLRIGFVGSVRYEEENLALLRQFKDSAGVFFDYWGTQAGGCDLKKQCDSRYPNVSFHGPFRNRDKADIYSGVDVINSIYGVSSRETTSAVPNRFYDAALYGRPIIVSKGTYLANLVDEYHLGFAVDVFSDDIPELLDLYIDQFDPLLFEEGQLRLMEDVARDLRECRDAICLLVDRNIGR